MTRTDPARRSVLERGLPWLALGVALSPVLVELVRTVPVRPFALSFAIGPVLLARAAYAERARSFARRPALGVPLLVAGLALETIGLGGASFSVAAAALPAAVLGLALFLGFPSPMTALLACWAVPVPTFVLTYPSPGLESALARAGAAVFTALGVPISVSGPLVRLDGSRFELEAAMNGLHLGFVLAGLAWYASARAAAPVAAALRRAALGALLGLPLQLVATWVAFVVFVAGAPGLAWAWLEHGLWLVTAVAGFVWVERRARG